MAGERLAQQVAFLVEADKLKTISRRTLLVDLSRRENSAEHSWHLVLAAMVLREYASERFDLLHVLELVAVHDLVEIDAGDTFAYDALAQVDCRPTSAHTSVRCGRSLRPSTRRRHVSPTRSIAFSPSSRMPTRVEEAGGHMT
jgi:hypothetical protein